MIFRSKNGIFGFDRAFFLVNIMVIGERFTHEKQRNLYRLNGNVWWEIHRLQRLRSGQTMVKTLNKDHGNHQYIAFVVVCFNININYIYIYINININYIYIYIYRHS